MLEKIKSWNWPVIWSVLCTLIWGVLTRIMFTASNSPVFESARNASTVSSDTLYGFVLALCVGSVVALIVSAWHMVDRLLGLPCFARKRKK